MLHGKPVATFPENALFYVRSGRPDACALFKPKERQS
jgi:hypothetical protein